MGGQLKRQTSRQIFVNGIVNYLAEWHARGVSMLLSCVRMHTLLHVSIETVPGIMRCPHAGVAAHIALYNLHS